MNNKEIKERKMLKHTVKTIVMMILIFAAVVSLYPLVWSIYSSFKTSTEILTSPLGLPKGLYYENYINAFVKAKMGLYFMNTVVITFVALGLLLVMAVPTAYVLSRFRFRFRKTIKKIYVMGLFLQSTIYLVPLFLLLNKLHMLDNRLALCIVYAVSSLPFTIYLLTGFMKGLPVEYEEAAKIDGCGYFKTLFEIIVPMTKPAIITIVIFNFLGFFNEFPIAFTFITSEHKKTLPIGLQNLMEIQRYATDWGALFAGLAIVTIPTIVLYAFTQKKLTEGVSLGGLKG